MNKKMREILTQIQTKTGEAKSFMVGENKDITKANDIMDEVEVLQKEYDAEKRIYDTEKANGVQSATAIVGPVEDPKIKNISGEELIAKEVRAIMAPQKFGADKTLSESVDANGGYTVPEDIQTKVNQWPEAQYSFLADISEETVSTNKGSRTYQKKTDTDAFVDLDENGAITTEITAPQFERISYNIQDRAGFMPVSNDLVNDSDANIMGIVTEWLGRANIATANAKVKAILNAHKNKKKDGTYEATAGAKEINGINGIKEIVTVILGQAYKSGAKIITNDDGLQYLDTLTDNTGRPLLNPDPTDSAKLQLRCGTVVIPIKVIPNKHFPTVTTETEIKVPFVVGDLKAGIRRYNRQSMSLMASNVATIGSGENVFNAFAMNMTLIRAILRDDYKELDKDAYVYGYIDTTPAGE